MTLFDIRPSLLKTSASNEILKNFDFYNLYIGSLFVFPFLHRLSDIKYLREFLRVKLASAFEIEWPKSMFSILSHIKSVIAARIIILFNYAIYMLLQPFIVCI